LVEEVEEVEEVEMEKRILVILQTIHSNK